MNPIFLLLFFSLFSLPPFSSSHGFHFPSLLKPSQISKRHNSDQKSSHGYETKHFTQILDHFNYHPKSYISFQQRYLVNGDYWGGAAKSSPIFVYAGNEASIDIFADNNGFLLDIAPTFEALIVFIEHRYYGKSFPFGSEEEAFQNATTAGYLSISQALADYAAFVVDLKKNLSAESSPVVVFGGSYGGMLAAWFRLKYPHLAIGALASSAPILQIDPTFDPYIFNDIITKDYRSTSENCYKVIKNSWDEIDKAYNDSIKLEKMESSLRLCKGQGLYTKYWLSNALIYAAMTDYPTPSDLLQPLPAYPVNEAYAIRIMGSLSLHFTHQSETSPESGRRAISSFHHWWPTPCRGRNFRLSLEERSGRWRNLRMRSSTLKRETRGTALVPSRRYSLPRDQPGFEEVSSCWKSPSSPRVPFNNAVQE
ncbi:lysosomal Pro-X carboxypeptidase-like [Dendrobium catenatum]|uniref:lysosomal Pro-X carboxypeptidase-like n=1 Tax=Dendrobium catenatum TaxID=906689 RepID=UPI00109F2B58|nr:lysosomal Pro-X carboxypeptidase-like [Dendrobium catenatum]